MELRCGVFKLISIVESSGCSPAPSAFLRWLMRFVWGLLVDSSFCYDEGVPDAWLRPVTEESAIKIGFVCTRIRIFVNKFRKQI